MSFTPINLHFSGTTTGGTPDEVYPFVRFFAERTLLENVLGLLPILLLILIVVSLFRWIHMDNERYDAKVKHHKALEKLHVTNYMYKVRSEYEKSFTEFFEGDVKWILGEHKDILKMGLIPPQRYLIEVFFEKEGTLENVTDDDWELIDLLMHKYDEGIDAIAQKLEVSNTEAGIRLSRIYDHFGVEKKGSANRMQNTIEIIRELLMEMELLLQPEQVE